MTGVVLCGGNSTRMGTDKGLLKQGEQTWAELAAQKLTALHLPVIVSINRQQLPAYEQIFRHGQLVPDHEQFDAKAPLFGLLSAHLELPQEDLFVLACDIRDIDQRLLRHLLDRYNQGTDECYVYQTGDRPQPLCSIYTAEGLRKIYRLFREGNLKRFSMMHVLELLPTDSISVNQEDLPFFNNYNSPQEG
ncbi:molybdenum cofactor guanylyltransferase [Flavisolibacter nicotianae]|uniref:molybdenum cofactor guanylyltransferase n=1 Tax=Flavisolibacter nicotianae TaxID=2364882 RepID=UPI000EAE6226|nr:molybdenum cofactor guanylyltransferase [Flavisolibacter nicotianae]